VNTIELGGEEEPVISGAAADGAGQLGQPLLFVHGLSGSWPNWLEQLPVLAAEHRVLALDLPGFGHSPVPAGEISIAGYARLLDRLLDQLGIDNAAVVGNSMGGLVAAEMAIAFSERVERLVLVSAAGVSTYGEPRAARAAPAIRRLEWILAAAGSWTASKSELVAARPRVREATMKLVVRHPGELPAALAAEQMRGMGKPGFVAALEATLSCDLRPRLAEIACPTLIVWGDRDRLVSVRDAGVFAEEIPNSREVIFNDTGHMAMLERPARFNSLLREFLSE
jgi:pimeloyl-ACP methyl ester carboxylesterase